ncbi:MAG TPA: transglycosylase SLT domain-containing protein [Steroidobacteraceae bacterium]|nr:transglycosylase SLT domain-containing protein [Steroidobacteraceae bacterium]
MSSFVRKAAARAAALCAALLAALAVATASSAAALATLAPSILPSPSSLPGNEPPALSQQFIAALRRVRLNLPEPPDTPALQAYVIYDYLVAARLRRDLSQQPSADLDTTIDTFLQAHAGQPVGHALLHDWLESLALRRRWDWFLPRSREVNDPALACARLQGLLATGQTEGLAPLALARWGLPQQQPAACEDAFAWLRLQHLLTPALAESRTRAALEAENPRLARAFAVDVPAPRAAMLLQWAQLLEAPQPTLSSLAHHPSSPVEPEALFAGFDRLARVNSTVAANLLPSLLARPDSSPALQTRLRRAVALGAAYDHDPAALAAFDGFSVESADDPAQEWRVRAALWAADYVRALGWIEQMPAGLATLPRWRYWRARAVDVMSGEAAAAPLYADLADLRDYYGYLAADRLRRGYNLNAKPSPDDPAEQATLAAEPGLVRARALFDCDLADDASLEWNTVLRNAEPSVKIQAARLASRWGMYAQSIATLAQTGAFDDVRLRYPRPFPAALAHASRLVRLPEDWILAVMRQESLFRKDAVSHAGARGLMQMLPGTATAVAKRWHLPPPGADGLFDPLVAIPLGAAHLRELLDRYDGRLALSLAAYNAGESSLARWLPERSMDAAVWVENIPYNETRGYVQHILEHLVAFAWVQGAELPRLTSLMAPVRPAGVVNAEPSRLLDAPPAGARADPPAKPRR